MSNTRFETLRAALAVIGLATGRARARDFRSHASLVI
jgi:hypothetical protein